MSEIASKTDIFRKKNLNFGKYFLRKTTMLDAVCKNVEEIDETRSEQFALEVKKLLNWQNASEKGKTTLAIA